MKTVAVIPARAGSKGIPGKNTYPILGKPLISYSIESALQSTKISSIVVSSDDQKVQKIVRDYKKVLFHKRPARLAEDDTKIVDVLINLFMIL